MKLLLLFTLFSLPLMAQDHTPSLEKKENLSLRCIGKISHKGQPLFLVDGKKISKWNLKLKRLQLEDIAHIMLFSPEKAKGLFGSSAKNGMVYIITKETFQRAEALAGNPPSRKLSRKERHYIEIWNFYQTQRPTTVSGKVTDKGGNPLSNVKVRNNDRNTEVFTDSLGNYTIEADRWDAIQAENIEDCYLVVQEEKEQSHNFVQYPPVEKARISDPRASTPSITFKTPCDKLFVLDGIPIEEKEKFLKEIRRKKIEEIIELDGRLGTPLYGAMGVYGVIIVNTKRQ